MATKTTDSQSREVRATAKFVRVSPSKVRLVLDLVRGKDVSDAFDILHFCDRHAAVDVEKVLKSAVANAENNNGMRASDLFVKFAFADQGPTLKRIRPRAKGSASRILKRSSHITIVVAPRKEA